jgi:hypothetical protein
VSSVDPSLAPLQWSALQPWSRTASTVARIAAKTAATGADQYRTTRGAARPSNRAAAGFRAFTTGREADRPSKGPTLTTNYATLE